MPNRILNSGICTSESMAGLSWFEQNVFLRLIVTVDDYGRMDARPAILRGVMFPLHNVTDKQITEALAKLSTAGMVDLYSVGGRSYLQLTAWNRYQTPRAKSSRYPSSESTCEHMQADENMCEHMQADVPDIRIRYSSNDIRYSDSVAVTRERTQDSTSSPEVGEVMSLYMDRVNALPTEQCTAELVAFTRELGSQVVCHAINKALDDKKATWSYIRAILRDYKQQGLNTLAAVQLLVGCRSQSTAVQERYEAEKEQIKADYEAQIAEVRAQAEAGIYATQYLDDSEYFSDAWRLGCWLTCLDDIYPGLTTEAKALAVWCIFNRVDSDDYPPDIEDTLYQEGQFCEYNDKVTPTEENIVIAKNQLSRWHNGDIRPVPTSAVFLTVSTDGVVLRSTFEETNKTGYWRA